MAPVLASLQEMQERISRISYKTIFLLHFSNVMYTSPALLHEFDAKKGLTVHAIKSFLNDFFEPPTCHLLFEKLGRDPPSLNLWNSSRSTVVLSTKPSPTFAFDEFLISLAEISGRSTQVCVDITTFSDESGQGIVLLDITFCIYRCSFVHFQDQQVGKL